MKQTFVSSRLKTRLITTAALAAMATTAAVADQVQIQLPLQANIDKFPQTASGYWDKTYSCLGENQHLEIGIFRLSHNVSEDPESTEFSPAWNGFIPCTNSSTTDYYDNGTGPGWYTNQWGCMAGGGIISVGENNTATAAEGVPYIVADWASYYDGTLAERICNITFTTPRLYQAVGVFVCPAPWPYYGNISGDGFARPLDQQGDEMSVTFHGLDADGNETGQVKHILARAVADGNTFKCEQNPDWAWVDLSDLGQVKSIYATMATTDTGEWGPNGATYFCMDRLTVAAEANLSAPQLITCVLVDGTTPTFTWSAVDNATSYNVYLDGNPVATGIEATTYVFDNLDASVSHSFGIQAADNATGAISPVEAIELTLAGINSVTADRNNAQGLAAIDFDLPVEYFTADGRRGAAPAHGFFIVRQGANTAKIYIP